MGTTINTRYVDVDAEVGGTGTTNGLTGGTCAYKSLSIWEAARDADLTTGDGGGNYVVEKAICGSAHANHTADTTAVSISEWTTSANSYISIETNASNRAGTSWSTSKYRLDISNANAIHIAEDYVRIDGLQIGHSSINGSNSIILLNGQTATNNDARVSGCFLRGVANTTYAESGIYVSDADANITVWNTIVCNIGVKADSGNVGVFHNGSTCNLYSCTIDGGYYGVRALSGKTITAKNCYAEGSNTAWKADGTITMTSCAASDTSASGTNPLDNVAYDTDTFVNVTAGSEDLALAADGLSPLVGAGATLTDDPPGSTALGVDILGTTRS